MNTTGNFTEYNKQQFYENWAEAARTEPFRIEILKWKGQNLSKLYNKLDIVTKFKTIKIAEIGGAEGIVLSSFIEKLNTPLEAYNFELSKNFIDIGNKLYPNIHYINTDPTKEKIKIKFDILILSDIIEHIENDEYFLESCAEITNYILIKLPLENTLHTKFLRKIGKLSDLGVVHPAGHLHEYNIKTGINLIKKQFEIIDFFCEDMPFNLRPSENLTVLGKIDNRIIRRLCYYYLPGHIYSKFYDSSLFVLAKSKRINNDMNYKG